MRSFFVSNFSHFRSNFFNFRATFVQLLSIFRVQFQHFRSTICTSLLRMRISNLFNIQNGVAQMLAQRCVNCWGRLNSVSQHSGIFQNTRPTNVERTLNEMLELFKRALIYTSLRLIILQGCQSGKL